MAALLTADTCPSCKNVHEINGGCPGDWPTCPEHGHWLYVLRGPLATKDNPGGGWTYACQAPGCKHQHTQREKATMTTANEQAAAALALRDGQSYWDDRQLAALQQLGLKDVTRADLTVYLHYCQKTGLDPFSRQIYMIGRKSKDGTVKQTIQVGIDGYRVIAARAARRDGVVLSYGDTVWYDADGRPHDVWVFPVPPAAAKVVVYRDGKPFPGVARFASFAPVTRDGQLMGLWATMPDHQVAKCAEAQALRRAFPQDLEAIRTDDETAHLGNRAPAPPLPRRSPPGPLDPRDVEESLAEEQPQPKRRGRRQGQRRVAGEWERLGVTDHDEQMNLTAKVAGDDDILDSLDDLTEQQCHTIADRLAECKDIGQVHALLDGGDKPGPRDDG